MVVQALLDKGATVNIQDEDGYTALTRASLKGHEGVVKALLEKGASA